MGEPNDAGRETERVRRYYKKIARAYDRRLRRFDRVTLGDGRSVWVPKTRPGL